MTTTNVVILAAGLGTRMRSKYAKVLHQAGGLTLIEHVVQAARAVAPAERIVVVTGHQAEHVEALLKPTGVQYVRQVEQKGTGHAVLCTRGQLEKSGGLVLVLYGDVPLLPGATIRKLREEQDCSDAAATIITTTVDDPTGYGRIVEDADGNIQAIVEHKAARADQLGIRRINSGICCFRADLLWKFITEIRPDNEAQEFYLTDLAALLTKNGHKVRQMHEPDSSLLLGINTRAELAAADTILRARKTRELMLAGVTIEKPETVTIDMQVRVGEDTIIEPFARITGDTRIGEDCKISHGAIIESSELSDSVTVGPYTWVANSRVEAGAQVGPFARVRMDSRIGPEARVGNFVELKKTRLGADAKSQHLAYLGDSDIGERVNIGAGTITCNYDGSQKHPTRIGAGSFIGSNSTLVAPLEIGDDSYVGAGSVITEGVPDGALALGRGRQVIKEGWTAARKKKAKKA